MEYSPKKMQETIIKNNFRFKKAFGQNFIIDENIIDNIIKRSNIDKETLIIEIGPGAGSLTAKIGEKAKEVICYEIDKSLEKILTENLKTFDNINIIYDDFLKRNINEDIKNYNYKKISVVANLPYYITTPIIVKLIEEKIDTEKIIVMVQKEVGDRFKAKVGTKEYNSLTIFLNYYYDIKKILDVSRNVFMPKPNVDSIVIELVQKENKPNVNEEVFFKLIRDSFKQKRKNLRNNLIGYDQKKISEVLAKYGFDLRVRAEQLEMNVFVDIANSL